MHLRVLYIVMVCSGTSVRSTRRRRGAKLLAVAAAALHCRKRRRGVLAADGCGCGSIRWVWLGTSLCSLPIVNPCSPYRCASRFFKRQPLRVVPEMDISVSSHRLLQHPHFMKIHNTTPQVDHFVFSVGHTVFGLEGRRPNLGYVAEGGR